MTTDPRIEISAVYEQGAVKVSLTSGSAEIPWPRAKLYLVDQLIAAVLDVAEQERAASTATVPIT